MNENQEVEWYCAQDAKMKKLQVPYAQDLLEMWKAEVGVTKD